MNKKFALISSFFLVACENAAVIETVDIESQSSLESASALTESVFPKCERTSQALVKKEILFSIQKQSDTVCFYNDFPFKDTICCFGEASTFLQRDQNGSYMNVSTDFAIVFSFDTLYAAADPAVTSKCLANIDGEQYSAVKIGDQTWLSKNAKGGGRCLFDVKENCELFGSLMPYGRANDFCSGDFRLPTLGDVEKLLHSVGAEIQTVSQSGVCGEVPFKTSYYKVPLFVDSQDSLVSGAYNLNLFADGGVYDENYEGDSLVYSLEKTCIFLQTDENSKYVNAFCYSPGEKRAFVTTMKKSAELYARCIMM